MARVEQFFLWLPEANHLLHQASTSLTGLDAFEATLCQSLPSCKQLIRWAIIRVEHNQLLCEGAYLTQS